MLAKIEEEAQIAQQIKDDARKSSYQEFLRKKTEFNFI